MIDHTFYFKRLYPFQDQVLQVLSQVDTGFYLTGGTALSRGYLNHRFSDDLDLFVNDNEFFTLWADRAIQALVLSPGWTTLVQLREKRYVRINLTHAEITLKIEFVNDVPSRVGEPWLHSILGKIDTAENILANKVTAAIDRSAPKDLADIWGLCYQKGLSLVAAITGAQGKAAGVFPLDLARVLCSVTRADWDVVRWVIPPDPDQFVTQLVDLGKSLIFMA